MAGLTLDTGALIGLECFDRRVIIHLKNAELQGHLLTVPTIARASGRGSLALHFMHPALPPPALASHSMWVTAKPDSTTDEATRLVVAQALRLSESQLLRVAAELLESLEGPPDDVSDEDWLAEINRRADRVRRGESQAESWQVVRGDPSSAGVGSGVREHALAARGRPVKGRSNGRAWMARAAVSLRRRRGECRAAPWPLVRDRLLAELRK